MRSYAQTSQLAAEIISYKIWWGLRRNLFCQITSVAENSSMERRIAACYEATWLGILGLVPVRSGRLLRKYSRFRDLVGLREAMG